MKTFMEKITFKNFKNMFKETKQMEKYTTLLVGICIMTEPNRNAK